MSPAAVTYLIISFVQQLCCMTTHLLTGFRKCFRIILYRHASGISAFWSRVVAPFGRLPMDSPVLSFICILLQLSQLSPEALPLMWGLVAQGEVLCLAS